MQILRKEVSRNKEHYSCDAEDCQAKYAHEKKNAKRRESDNGDYRKYQTKLSNYIGQQKTKLSVKVDEDKAILDRFDKERKVYTQILKDKIEEYQAENRLPDDEMKEFYVKLRTKFNAFWRGLAAE